MAELIELLQTSNTNEHDNILSEICRRTKSYDSIEELFNLNGCETLFPFLRSETEGIINKALSVFANCTNLDERWRKAVSKVTAQKMKFFIEGFFSKCDQIRRKLRIWSHLLKKSSMENFTFCAVILVCIQIRSCYVL